MKRTPLKAKKHWNPTRKPMKSGGFKSAGKGLKRGTKKMKQGGSFMSPALREDIGNDPEYNKCCFSEITHPGGQCEGRITREHAVIYAGSKIQTKWAIIPCCAKHHAVDQFQDAGTMVKDMNIWVALNRATDNELESFEKADFIAQRDRLNEKYGVWFMPTTVY